MKKTIIAVGIIALLVIGVVILKPKSSDSQKTTLIEKVSINSPNQVDNNEKENGQDSFKDILSYIPENTSYLFGNKNPPPRDYLTKTADKLEKSLGIIRNILDEDIPKLRNNNKFRNSLNFFFNYYDIIIKNMKEGTLKNIGYTESQRFFIYGYKLYPVVRGEIGDSKKLINTINKIAEDSNISINWKKCGQFDCLKLDGNKTDDMFLTFVVKDKSVVFSAYDYDMKDEMYKHLTEKSTVKNSFSVKKFDDFLASNNFKGYGDGFIDINRIGNFFIEKVGGDKSCSSIVKDILQKVNRISIGSMEKLTAKKSAVSVIIHMDKNLTKIMQNLTNKNMLTKRSANPIFDVGLNINTQNLSKAIMSLGNFLIEKGNQYGCKKIDPQMIRQGTAMVSMSIGMAVGNISEAYVSLDKFEMMENGQNKSPIPSRLSLFAQVASENPSILINMIQTLIPPLANLNIPPTGEEVDLFQYAPKPAPSFIKKFTASLKDNVISVEFGEDAKTVPFKPKEHSLIWSSLNYQRYAKFIIKTIDVSNKTNEAMIKVLMEQQNSEEAKKEYQQMLEKMKKDNEQAKKIFKIFEQDSIFHQEVYINDKGLVIEFIEEDI